MKLTYISQAQIGRPLMVSRLLRLLANYISNNKMLDSTSMCTPVHLGHLLQRKKSNSKKLMEL